MRRPPAIPSCTWLALLLPLALQATSTAETQPPNIVLIVADDLGYGDVGCYGSTLNKTPNIDRLAATGLRFTDFHSNGPMCTPTRAAMLTGLYQQRFGKEFDGPLSGKTTRDHGLPLEAVTMAEVLKPRQYASVCFGKWHLGYIPPWLPTGQGFDVFRGLGSGDGDHHTHIDRSGREDWWHNNAVAMEEGYTADLLTKYSIEFIEHHEQTPFFLYVPHLAIHFPWQGPSDRPHRKKGKDYWNDKWGIIPDPENVAPHIKAMVESVDDSVGRIVATLERLQLTDRTLVVFTSDNGGYLTYEPRYRNISSNGPLRAQKGSLYEGGHRVPTIFHWPGRIAPAVTDETAMSIDLLPTFASIAEADTKTLQLDGVNLSPLLFQGQPLPKRDLFWRMRSQKAVRRGPWKLVEERPKQIELYNLDIDLEEQHDLADERPELIDELRNAWNHWEDEVNQTAEAYNNN
jgi:arylsulfatase A